VPIVEVHLEAVVAPRVGILAPNGDAAILQQIKAPAQEYNLQLSNMLNIRQLL
jgi:hypothetical protein